MVKVIQTTKADIETGFDIDFEVPDLFGSTKAAVKAALIQNGYDTSLFTDEFYRQVAESRRTQLMKGLRDLLDKATEIFFKEATLSIWSGNMSDNAVVAMAGDIIGDTGNRIAIDVRIGVSKEAISTGNGTWLTRFADRPDYRNPTGLVYEYNGYRMRPGVDYSKYLNDGTARTPKAASWAGFVKRAEDRFNAL